MHPIRLEGQDQDRDRGQGRGRGRGQSAVLGGGQAGDVRHAAKMSGAELVCVVPLSLASPSLWYL